MKLIVILIQYLYLLTIHSNFMVTRAFSCACDNQSSTGASYRKCTNGTCHFKEYNFLQQCYIEKHEKGCTLKPDCDTEKVNGEKENKTFIMCCGESMCNEKISGEHLHPVNFTSNEDVMNSLLPPKKKAKNSKIVLLITLPCSVVLLVVSIIFLAFKIKKQYQNKRRRNADIRNSLLTIPRAADINQFQEFSTSGSGSGVGIPLLVKQTISWQIAVKDLIGSGAFGNVYHGIYNGVQNVAIKILSTNEEESWEHEKDLYLTTTLAHTNILGFIGADRKDNGVSIQLWLVFDYHRAGSLYDFLHEKTVDLKTMFEMVWSIVAGLDHLHKPIIGIVQKPAIAHRDLKTKNILVKAGGTCCLADFGLSHKDATNTQNQNKTPSAKIGTRRYRAPELLNYTINVNRFDAFRKADMYAFALCLWELCRRTEIEGLAEEYELPYYDDVPANPTEDDMRRVVCVQGKRPNFPEYWQRNQVMKTMMDIMTECWYPDPFARLPIARVRKRLLEISIEEVVNANKTSTTNPARTDSSSLNTDDKCDLQGTS